MSVIVRNEYGAIAVNKGVIERMIVQDMLGMPDILLLADKRGRPIKDKPTPFIDPDYFDAVEVSDKKGQVKVKLYIVVRFGINVSEAADKIFDSIENDFALLMLEKPYTISVKVRGVEIGMSGAIVKRNIDVVRNNN